MLFHVCSYLTIRRNVQIFSKIKRILQYEGGSIISWEGFLTKQFHLSPYVTSSHFVLRFFNCPFQILMFVEVLTIGVRLIDPSLEPNLAALINSFNLGNRKLSLGAISGEFSSCGSISEPEP